MNILGRGAPRFCLSSLFPIFTHLPLYLAISTWFGPPPWQTEYSSAWIPLNATATRARVADLSGTGAHQGQHGQEGGLGAGQYAGAGPPVQHLGSSRMLEVSEWEEVRTAEWNGRDCQLWTRSWDNCLENKASGQVLFSGGG